MASLEENYAGGGFGHALQPGHRPALIVVDFVMAYLKPGSPLYAGVETARDACAVLLHAARAAGIPVLHTNVRFQAGGRDEHTSASSRPWAVLPTVLILSCRDSIRRSSRSLAKP